MRGSGSLIESAAFVIKAFEHVVDFVVEPFPPPDPAAALQAAMRGERQETPLMVPLIYTGVAVGPVDLVIEGLSERPEISATAWEDIHELSLTFPEGKAYFNEPTGRNRKDVGTIEGEEKGTYRVRLHATGRDTAFDDVVESPVERHLVQFWKEPPSPVSVLLSQSERGKSLPRFITMWQGPPGATAGSETQLLNSPPEYR